MMRDHETLVISDHRGLFDRGRDDSVPVGHYQDCLNLEFDYRGVKTRRGSELSAGTTNIVRMLTYTPTNQVSRKIMLSDDGHLFDELYYPAAIMFRPAMTDFSLQTMFGRAYISPHDGQTGLPAEVVYVYQGAGVSCRPAAGAAYSGALGTSTPAAGGHIEPGLHAYSVVFETDTGFITSPASFALVGTAAQMAAGDRVLNFAGLPLGPAGTIARHILITKSFTGPTLSFDEYEYFFAAKIADNVTTVYNNLNFYDSDLVSSAEYLKDNLQTIPAGILLAEYNGRLAVGGENANPSLLRFSAKGNPENISALQGYVIVNPGDAGGGVKVATEYRGNFHIYKTNRAYVTEDNGDAPTTWPVNKVDVAIGTECFGLSRVSDAIGNTHSIYLVAARQGLVKFNGNFDERELTWKIKDLWLRINPLYFNKVQVYIDPQRKQIFVNVPLDANTTCNMILFGDYTEGLDSQNIKWCPWLFTGRLPKTILVENDTVSQRPVLKWSGGNGILALSETSTHDIGPVGPTYPINCYLVTAGLPDNLEGDQFHLSAVSFRGSGVGNLSVTVYDQDMVNATALKTYTLTNTPNKDFVCLANNISEKFYVKLAMPDLDSRFSLYRLRLFIKSLWTSRVL